MAIQRLDHVGVVVEDLEAAIAFFSELGLELDGQSEVARFEDSYLLCYVRGPAGVIVALAEQLG